MEEHQRADDPEPLPISSGLEVVPNADINPKYPYIPSNLSELPASDYASKADLETNIPWVSEERICGLRRKTFFITLCIALIIVGAALGGGIGGGIAASNAKKSTEKSTTNNATISDPEMPSPGNSSAADNEGSLSSPRKATALASTSWVGSDGAENAHLYFQAANGDLRVRTLKSPDGWSNQTSSFGESFLAKNGTPLYANSWPGNNGNREIRLYYVSPDDVICEATSSVGEWTNGDLVKSQFRIGNGSRLISTGPWDGQEQAVYFQNKDGNLARIVNIDNKWKLNQTLSSSELNMIEGSGLALQVVTDSDTDDNKTHLEIVVQSPEGAILQQKYFNANDSWLEEPGVVYNDSSIYKGTALTMGDTKTSADQQRSESLFFLGTRGEFNEMHWDATTLWSIEPKNLGTGDKDSGLTVLVMKDPEPALSAYFYTDSDGVKEMQLQDSGNFGFSDFKLD